MHAEEFFFVKGKGNLSLKLKAMKELKLISKLIKERKHLKYMQRRGRGKLSLKLKTMKERKRI